MLLHVIFNNLNLENAGSLSGFLQNFYPGYRQRLILGSAVEKELQEIIAEVREYIDENYCRCACEKDMAYRFNIDIRDMQGGFKIIYGCTISEYINKKRLERLNELILETIDNPQINYYYMLELGFKTESGFCNFVKRITGMTFRKYFQFYKENLQNNTKT